jgi:aromatic-L-amino-acid decarboxylase
MTLWNHPGWFAYFPGNNSPPSILGEMLTAALGAQCMSWATSPAATELEQVVMDWLRQMLGLPDSFVGVIQDTASTATLVALLSARERTTAYAAGTTGLAQAGAQLVVYASREAHSSVDKAV